MGYSFSDISAIKTYVGAAANQSLSIEDLDPVIENTLYDAIIPYLGLATWTALLANQTADTPDAALTALMPKVQKPLAMITMANYMSVGTISVGDAGAHRNESEAEGRKTAYKYQINRYVDYHLHNGWDALERMLLFLEDNIADYSTWNGSDEAAYHRELFLNYAADFKRYFQKSTSRYTFETLRPIIAEAEQFAILPLLGQQQFDDLKGSPTSEQQKVLPYIKKALVHLTVAVAIKRTWIRIEGQKVIQTETLEPQGYEKQAVPSMQSMSLFLEQEKEFASRWLDAIKDYLTTNIDTFPLYKAHIDAIAAAEEEEETEENNNERCGSCGENTCCCNGYTRKSDRKGVINL